MTLAPTKAIITGISTRDAETADNYSVRYNSRSYKGLCGREDDTAANMNLLTRFSEQIGCLNGPQTPNTWRSRQNNYLEKFRKGRNCFSRRVTRMGNYTAKNKNSLALRKSHAYAARAAYTMARNCLRKAGTHSEGLNPFTTSSNSLLEEVNIKQPGVRDAILSGKSTIEEAIFQDPDLKPIYENTYGLSPEQWEIYHRFLLFSTLNATKYRNGPNVSAAIHAEYNKAFHPTLMTDVATPPPQNTTVTSPGRASPSSGGGGIIAAGGAGSQNNIALLIPAPLIPNTDVSPYWDYIPTGLTTITDKEIRTLIPPSIKSIIDAFDLDKISKLLQTSQGILTKLPTRFTDDQIMKNILLPIIFASAAINIQTIKQNWIELRIDRMKGRASEKRYYKNKFQPQILSLHLQMSTLAETIIPITIGETRPIVMAEFVVLTKYLVRVITDLRNHIAKLDIAALSWNDIWPQLPQIDKIPEIQSLLN